MATRIRTVLGSNSSNWRNMARGMCTRLSEFSLIGEGSDGAELFDLCAEYMPDLVLIGPLHCDDKLWEYVGLIRKEFPSVRLVMEACAKLPDVFAGDIEIFAYMSSFQLAEVAKSFSLGL